MKSWRTKLIFVIGLFAVLSIGGWLYARQTEAFVQAKQFIEHSPEVASQIGPVKSVSLTPFGYKISRSGGTGNASFTLKVRGERGLLTVHSQLIYQGNWSVTSATLSTSTESIPLPVKQ